MQIFLPDVIYTGGVFVKDCGVAVENGVIAAVDKAETLCRAYPGAETVRWDKRLLLPGTVNVHNHSFQSLLRGIAADRPFLEWRDQSLYRFSPKMRVEDLYTGAVFAFTEMMLCGVTTVSDFFYLHNFGTESDEAIIAAARDVGIRLVLARTMYDWDGAPSGYVESIADATENTRRLAKKYNGSGMTTVLPAPHSLHAASPEMILSGHRLAAELGTKFHIHVAEEPFEVEQVKKEHGGLQTIEYLNTLGVVDSSMAIIHGVWLKPEEIALLGARGGSLAYCPSSNMFLADGITDIPAMRRAGVRIGLGTDGACSNNRISVLEEMRMVSLLQKAKTVDAMVLNYRDAFDMGTKDGAALLDLPTGEIAAGKCADLIGVALDDLSMQPLTDAGEQMLPNVVYSMQPSAVKEVVVNGRATVQNGVCATMKSEKVIAMVQDTMRHLEA